MIRNPRNLLWILPVLLFVSSPLWQPSLAAFLAPRGGYTPDLMHPEPTSPVQNFIMDVVAITLTSNGKEEWQIDADRAYTGENDHEILMEGVHARYIGNEKEPTIINSRRGKYSINERHLVLIEDVVITKPISEQQLFSDLLHYYDATKMAVSPGPVRLKSPGLNLTAGRMDYDLATGAYDFSDRVKVDL
ncbi:LPS export ABC transporter periplasmic protein LptC [Desulfobulbus alkaliphilus]|uniref:LPS export ABC transporter periplasmic protein LptC n=1 Tax=Desulfobulbus alkaliphilus TaxID=869814 RepID=UPI0019625D07|nr:LPS export ABC transporter periplasmic protein LptC [Desulfobulbus alkaliphilus]MBM9536781.1 LPS export ABC transporter periplasmic protein LptC [Desulfobulbus alkaliphilus]